MSMTTACPLDCFDSCRVVVEDSKLHGDKSHTYTNGSLCPHLNHFHQLHFITKPTLNNQEISLDEALHVVKQKLESNGSKLYFKGSGNLGAMQSVTKHIFAQIDGSVEASGSLCDGAGHAGIVAGRTHNLVLPPEQIQMSEVVVVWGRNIHTTNSHLLPILKDKKVIVIDPYETALAKSADLFIQIKPHSDMFLALLIARFIIIDGIEDIEFLKEFCDDYEEFYELTQTIRIKQTLADIDVTLGQIGTFLNLVKNKKCSILVGLGAQKYSDGADVLRAIDGIGALLGLFGKEGSGVSFLADSLNGIKSPFATIKKETPKATCNFEDYNLVFIQGANPLGSMPNSSKVKSSLEKSEFIIYFGLYENETSKLANLVIPAKTFLGKNDIKFSYGSNEAFLMPKIRDENFGISEYELSSFLANELNLELKSEDEYIENFRSFTTTCNGVLVVKGRDEIPYKNGLEFEFLDEIDSELKLDKKLFLLTSKSKTSLNTQFKIDEFAYINSSHNIKDMSLIKVTSSVGDCTLHVKIDENLRDDCILIYSGNSKVNYLTPSKLSYDGKNAVFQELKVEILEC